MNMSRTRRLGLSVAKEDAIVSFMQTLTDGFMLVNQQQVAPRCSGPLSGSI
jgi:cytochrome c peroxidase